MAVLKTIKGRSLKLTMNRDGRTTTKSYADIGEAVADENILATAEAIGSIMAYPVEGTDLVTTESLKASV